MNMCRSIVITLFAAFVIVSAGTAQDVASFDLDRVTSLLKRGQTADIKAAAELVNAHPEHCIEILPQLLAAKNSSPLYRPSRLVLHHASTDYITKLIQNGIEDPYNVLLEDIHRRTKQHKTSAETGIPVKMAYDLIVQMMKGGEAVTISRLERLTSYRSTGLKMTDPEIDCLFNAIHNDKIVFLKTGRSIQSTIISTLRTEIPRVEDRLVEGLSHELPEHRAGVLSVLTASPTMRPELADRLLLMADDESDKVRNQLACRLSLGLRWCPHRVDDAVSLLLGFIKQPKIDRRCIIGSLSALSSKASLKQQQASIDAVLTLMRADSRWAPLAVNKMLKHLSEQQVRNRVDEWIVQLDNKDHVDNYLYLMASIGPNAIAAAPKIRDLLANTSDIKKQCAIAQQLFKIESNADNVLPIAMKGLSSSDVEIQKKALILLYSLGPSAKPALPKLTAMVNKPDADKYVVRLCIAAFRQMGPAAAPAAELIASFLDHEDKTIRVYSAQALKAIGPKAEVAVPQLIKDLRKKKPKNKLIAIKALGAIGPAAAPALDRLKQLANSRVATNEVKAAAKKAIVQISEGQSKGDAAQ